MLGYIWGIFGVYLGYIWGIFGVYLGYIWGIFGVYLGYIWGNLYVVKKSPEQQARPDQTKRVQNFPETPTPLNSKLQALNARTHRALTLKPQILKPRALSPKIPERLGELGLRPGVVYG